MGKIIKFKSESIKRNDNVDRQITLMHVTPVTSVQIPSLTHKTDKDCIAKK